MSKLTRADYDAFHLVEKTIRLKRKKEKRIRAEMIRKDEWKREQREKYA